MIEAWSCDSQEINQTSGLSLLIKDKDEMDFFHHCSSDSKVPANHIKTASDITNLVQQAQGVMWNNFDHLRQLVTPTRIKN